MLLGPCAREGKHVFVVHTEHFLVTADTGIVESGLEVLHQRLEFGKHCCTAPGEVVGIAYAHAVLHGGLLGGDENHTESCARTVDGAGSGILEHGDFLDVLGVEEAHVFHRHTVDNNQRSRIVAVGQSAEATDIDSGSTFDATVGAGDGQTGNSTLESLCHVGCGAAVHCACHIDCGHGAGEVGTLLRTVADSDEFVEHFSCGLQVHSHVGSGYSFHRLVAHIANLQDGSGRHTQCKMTECVGGNGIACNAFLHYRCTNRGLVVLIKNGTGDSGNRLTLLLGLGCSLRLESSKSRHSCHQKHSR